MVFFPVWGGHSCPPLLTLPSPGRVLRAQQTSPSFRPVNVRARTEKNFGGLHDCLGKSRVRVDAQGHIAGQRSHLNREYAFGNQLPRSSADDANSKYAFRLRVHQQLGHSFRTVKRNRPTRSCPGKLRHFDLAASLLLVLRCQPPPSHLSLASYDSPPSLRSQSPSPPRTSFHPPPPLPQS